MVCPACVQAAAWGGWGALWSIPGGKLRTAALALTFVVGAGYICMLAAGGEPLPHPSHACLQQRNRPQECRALRCRACTGPAGAQAPAPSRPAASARAGLLAILLVGAAVAASVLLTVLSAAALIAGRTPAST
jgi:hypothetical protein